MFFVIASVAYGIGLVMIGLEFSVSEIYEFVTAVCDVKLAF